MSMSRPKLWPFMTQGVSEQECGLTHSSFLLPLRSVSTSLKGFSSKQGFHKPQGELTHSTKPCVRFGLVMVITTVYAASEQAQAHISPRGPRYFSLWFFFFFEAWDLKTILEYFSCNVRVWAAKWFLIGPSQACMASIWQLTCSKKGFQTLSQHCLCAGLPCWNQLQVDEKKWRGEKNTKMPNWEWEEWCFGQ